jgi:nitrogen-specific signal transduction histidine kinase
MDRTDDVRAVAHDLNNLLTTIVGNADLLAESLPDGRDRHDAQQIGQAGRAAAELVRQLPLDSHDMFGGDMPRDEGDEGDDGDESDEDD